jgi:MFS family permease
MAGFLLRKKGDKAPLPPELKQLSPVYFAFAIIAFTMAALLINIINFSKIMWPGEPFHELDMGAIITARLWTVAFSGMIIGKWTDKYSRKDLLFLVLLCLGISYFLNGLVPEGLGRVTWIYFLICNILGGFGLGGLKPIILSYTNDFLKKDMRSRFFGIEQALGQVGLVLGMILSSILIQAGFWRVWFWFIGLALILSAFATRRKIIEPKRASQSIESLTEILGNVAVKYDYQMNKETIKSTFFRATNIIAFIEGTFTCVLNGTENFLILPYLQTPPHNVTSVATALVMVLFGLPGALFGTIGFARRADELGKRNIKHRANMIAYSIFWLAIALVIIFFIPIPEFTPGGTLDLFPLLLNPGVWVLGLIMLTISAVKGIYQINQSPILQAINLPEAQGKIMSWNQFLETIGQGAGPLIAGFVLSTTSANYMLTAFIIALIGIPGGFMWLYASRKIEKDVKNIDSILTQRTEELKKKSELK